MIKVLIVDDVFILCQGLKAILEQDAEFVITGMAHNGKEAYDLCEETHPDVVLMDMRMPEYDGAYGIQKIKVDFPTIKVLVLTTFDDEETIEAAMENGADGYILKEMEDGKIIQSIKSVYQGVSVLGESIFQHMKGAFQQKPVFSSLPSLTERERELTTLVAKGYSNKEIASILSLAEGTVKNNMSKILEKLNLKDRTQLAIYAIKNGLDC